MKGDLGLSDTELGLLGGEPGPVYAVGKLSVDLVHDFRVVEHLKLGVGGPYALNRVPVGLEAA